MIEYIRLYGFMVLECIGMMIVAIWGWNGDADKRPNK